MKMSNCITPTKENPVFAADCSVFGYIDGPFKRSTINNCGIYTFALDFTNAINDLHEWIKSCEKDLLEEKKCSFSIYLVDGSLDKYGEIKLNKVYTISSKKAKALLQLK